MANSDCHQNTFYCLSIKSIYVAGYSTVLKSHSWQSWALKCFDFTCTVGQQPYIKGMANSHTSKCVVALYCLQTAIIPDRGSLQMDITQRKERSQNGVMNEVVAAKRKCNNGEEAFERPFS